MVHFLFTFIKQNVRKALLALFLLSGTFIQAQGPVAGYDYLGACNGHNYYISQAFVFGININGVVADFQSKTAVPDNQVYAAAIVNAAENTCVTNLMLAYNIAHYGGNGMSYGTDWRNFRNPWIGLTDAAVENNFVWSNGQPNCEDFRNWNVGEPNNHAGTFSNGEDYTQLLVMMSYPYNGGTNDPLGKWNDWFNQFMISQINENLGPTTLPVIIEVGPADCAPVVRGNLGCSHGYWKNAKDAAWTGAGYSRTQTFSGVFNITNGRSVITLGVTTLQNALELGGGGYNNLARQGVAGLLNAGRGFYPYTVAEVWTAVRNMFNTGAASLPNVTVNATTYVGGSFTDAGSLATYLDQLNNIGCPLNNKGEVITSSSTSASVVAEGISLISEKSFAISGYPNPSKAGFNVLIDGISTEKNSIRITDINGRVIEQRSNIASNGVVKIGNNYRAGIYYLEVMQGANKKQLKLVKL